MKNTGTPSFINVVRSPVDHIIFRFPFAGLLMGKKKAHTFQPDNSVRFNKHTVIHLVLFSASNYTISAQPDSASLKASIFISVS